LHDQERSPSEQSADAPERHRDPATVRPRLAEAAAEGLEGIRKTLLDAATGAVRDHWITFECGECGARKRVEVPVPDVRARVAAIELLLREGLGRPPPADEVSVAQLPTNARILLEAGWKGEKRGGKREGGKLFVRVSVCAEAAEARLSSPTPILLSSPGGPPVWFAEAAKERNHMSALTELPRVRAVVALKRFRCASCAYGASSRMAPERCPMCGGTAWHVERRPPAASPRV
jgi:rubredoxin